jgi:YfiH family protein
MALIRPDWSAPESVHALTTTRAGGYSRGPWRSLNLGARCGDDAAAVSRNRERLASLLPAAPQWLHQVHGTTVIRHRGPVSTELEGDAQVAFTGGAVCAVLTADCLPVMFCNRRGSKVGVAHAGWRGMAAGVLEAAISAMDEEPAGLMAWLGPAIGAKVYEVGVEVKAAFTSAVQETEQAFSPCGDRWLLDLNLAARIRLGKIGIAQVYGGRHCTFSDEQKFFSYRRESQTGRMASLIWLQ